MIGIKHNLTNWSFLDNTEAILFRYEKGEYYVDVFDEDGTKTTIVDAKKYFSLIKQLRKQCKKEERR